MFLGPRMEKIDQIMERVGLVIIGAAIGFGAGWLIWGIK